MYWLNDSIDDDAWLEWWIWMDSQIDDDDADNESVSGRDADCDGGVDDDCYGDDDVDNVGDCCNCFIMNN